MERKEATALGLTKYETGRSCKNGHVAYRYTDSGTCSACINGSPTQTDCTTEITVYGTQDIFPQIKEIADKFNGWKLPHVPLNNYPFRTVKVRSSADIYRIKLTVPKGLEDEIKYLCACLLSKPLASAA